MYNKTPSLASIVSYFVKTDMNKLQLARWNIDVASRGTMLSKQPPRMEIKSKFPARSY